MKLNVGELRKERGNSEEFDSSLTPLKLEFQGLTTTFRQLRVKGTATNTGHEIYIKGTIDADGELTCSRCLENYHTPFQLTLEETYYRQGEVEPGAEEEDWRPYSGDVIDLDEAIREELLLSLPMKPICSPGCQGIRSGYGIVNEGERANHIDPRLAKLKEFFKKAEDGKQDGGK